jgi:hypothetical protein
MGRINKGAMNMTGPATFDLRNLRLKRHAAVKALGELEEPIIGESIKVKLPGETPWVECVAVYPDGTWDGRIDNRLFGEMSDHERAQIMKREFGEVFTVPRLHQYKLNDVVRFAREQQEYCECWVPVLRRASAHGAA